MFEQMGLDQRLLRSLEAQQIKTPTPIQSAVIPVAMAGKDVFASSKTGSGKTLAYLAPVMQQLLSDKGAAQGTRSLILAPTRELARQIFKVTEALARTTHLKAALITGGDDYKYQRALFRKDPEIIVATPGRLKEHMEQGTTLLDFLEHLVLDEADRMLELGFHEDVTAIAKQCHRKRQTLMLSATLDKREVANLAAELLFEPETITVQSDDESATAAIKQQVILADDIKHKERLLAWLVENQPFNKLLVFCNTREQVAKTRGIVRGRKIKADCLHSEMSQEDRNRVVAAFRSGAIKVLVATDVASRGLDISDIDVVINLDLARNTEDHIHRIGRTGRAGAEGLAISFVTSSDWDRKVTLENYCKTRFEIRTIKALLGKYKGPKKIKSSGKAAVKKKRSKTKADEKRGLKTTKKTSSKKPLIDGFAPMKKKRN